VTPKILVFAGSARAGSLNKKLARVAAAAVEDAGAEATLIDLHDFPMPLYDGDVEAAQGVPQQGVRLKELFKQHHGLLIASPENNGSVSALLKNALDWVSRPIGGEGGSVPYRNKVAALLAASPGALGGLRGLVHLRQILNALNVLVLAEQFALARAHEAFDAQGFLKDAAQRATVAAIAVRLVEVTRRLDAPG
jgi:chromate reductase, NAD(P)H dehydrogenase (quinone)